MGIRIGGPALVAVIAAGAVGGSAGAALGLGAFDSSPLGVSTGPGLPAVAGQPPVYPRNAAGETYGSALAATSPSNEPDLILVVTADGKQGYVRKHDLDEANGAAAAATFTNPAQALAWQAAQVGKTHTITVYTSDGTTIAGEFVVGSGDSLTGQAAK